METDFQQIKDVIDLADIEEHLELSGNSNGSSAELPDVLQLSKSDQRTMGRVARAPSHAATPNSLLMN